MEVMDSNVTAFCSLLKDQSHSLNTKAPLFLLSCPLFSKWNQT